MHSTISLRVTFPFETHAVYWFKTFHPYYISKFYLVLVLFNCICTQLYNILKRMTLSSAAVLCYSPSRSLLLFKLQYILIVLMVLSVIVEVWLTLCTGDLYVFI